MNRLILCPDDRTKSGYIEKEIEELIKNKPIPQNINEKIYIIVPEQYTLETEKKISESVWGTCYAVFENSIV